MSAPATEQQLTFYRVLTPGHDNQAIEHVSYEIRSGDTVLSNGPTLEDAIHYLEN